MITLLVSLYVACELTANVTASKPVAVGPIVVPAAVFVYTLTFTLIDLINERMGKAGARRAVYGAFAANLLLAAYVQLAVVLPAAPWWVGQAAYAGVLGSTPRIVFASLTAHLASSLGDVQVFAWWRERVKGPRWARVLVSNSTSTLADSVIFVTLAFWGALPVLPLILGQYVVKMAITVVSLPLIYVVRRTGP